MAFFKLDMYENTQTKPLFNALETHIAERLSHQSITVNEDELLLGQICGIEFAGAQTAEQKCRFHYLGSLKVTGNPVPPGYYNSVLVGSIHTMRGASCPDVSPDNASALRLAINQKGSFSGDILARAYLHTPLSSSRSILYSGSHLASLRLLSSGKADIAAIDCISYHLALQIFPELADSTCILGQTDPFPGLPFICSARLDPHVITAIKSALFGFTSQPQWYELASLLGVEDIVSLSAAHYPMMREFELAHLAK